jgi:hypothetical protein
MAEICEYKVDTNSFGYVMDEEDMFLDGFKTTSDLYLSAIARDIDINMPLSDICNKIKQETPSIEWQKLQMYWQNTLSRDEKDDLYDYISHGYARKNRRLRNNIAGAASINDIIEKSIPLDKDIIVYRYIRNANTILLENGEFTSYGYLSTSFDAVHSVTAVCKTQNMSIMKILVQKGTKCVCIPGRESEILFPHLTKLSIYSKDEADIVCQISDKHYSVIKKGYVYRCKIIS